MKRLALSGLSNYSTRSTRVFAGLLTGLLFATVTIQLNAQTAPDSRAQRPVSFGYDKAHEIALRGTIQEVVTKHTPGSPAGLHLLVASSQGMVDAHLGSYLTKDTQEALHAGEAVQFVGAMENIHGSNYLLVRQLIVGSRTITVRSEHGFLVPTQFFADPSKAPKAIQREINGGAR